MPSVAYRWPRGRLPSWTLHFRSYVCNHNPLLPAAWAKEVASALGGLYCRGLYWGKGLQTLFLCLLSISHTEPGSFEVKERTLWAVSEPAWGPGDWVANKTGRWFTVYEINEKQRASQGRALPKVTARQWQRQPRSLNPLTSCPRFLLASPHSVIIKNTQGSLYHIPQVLKAMLLLSYPHSAPNSNTLFFLTFEEESVMVKSIWIPPCHYKV